VNEDWSSSIGSSFFRKVKVKKERKRVVEKRKKTPKVESTKKESTTKRDRWS